jgi:hypothetical protein
MFCSFFGQISDNTDSHKMVGSESKNERSNEIKLENKKKINKGHARSVPHLTLNIN